MKGGGVSLVMQPLHAHLLAYEAEEYPAMQQSTTDIRIVPLPTGQDVLTEILRDGARRMGLAKLPGVLNPLAGVDFASTSPIGRFA